MNDARNAIEDALDPSRSLTTLAERASGPLIKPGNKFEPGEVGTEAAKPGERATTALKAAGDRVAASVTKVGDQLKKVTDQVKKAVTPKKGARCRRSWVAASPPYQWARPTRREPTAVQTYCGVFAQRPASPTIDMFHNRGSTAVMTSLMTSEPSRAASIFD